MADRAPTPVALLSRQGVRQLASGHPWIYPDHLVSVSEGASDGDLLTLEGPAGTPRGQAVWGAASRLPLRVVSREPSADLGPDFWAARLDRAVARRAEQLAPGEEACRLVHAEADGLPGLVVDRFGPVAVLQAGCRWADRVAPELARRLVEHHGLGGVLARHDGGFRKPEGLEQGVTLLSGAVPEQVEVRVAGLLRRVDPWRGQKTGLFLDQRVNQRLAAARLPVGRCLDAFCHDGGFGLQLAAAGSDVVLLDGSQQALDQATANGALNDLSGRLEPVRANAFEWLREQVAAGATFDGAVIDPPALAKRKGDRTRALRAYKELALRGLRLLRPGGRLLFCSCSFHMSRVDLEGALAAAAADARRAVTVLERVGAAPCHPELLTFPQSAYLKGALLEVGG